MSLRQCLPNADVLEDNFRGDISCEVLNRFWRYGVDLQELQMLKKYIPIVYPWDVEYDRLRYNVNRRFVFYPMAVVMCDKKKHVQRIFKWTRAKGIPITLRGGSHCFESYSLSDGIIIDQSQRTQLKIGTCNDRHLVKLQPGCLLGPTAKILSEYGLAFAGGSCPNVCVTGLGLGGGIGLLSRKYGLTVDNFLEIEVLLANGELVRVSQKEHADLFWALRGAGNQNFGIVTEMLFKVHPVEDVTIFDLIYSLDQLREVLRIWQEWAPTTTNDLTSEMNIYNDRVVVTGLYLGQADTLKKILFDTFCSVCPYPKVSVKEVSYIDSVRHFAGKGYWHPFFENKSGFAKESFPESALKIIEKWICAAGDEDHVELNAFGGAISCVQKDKTAFVHRDARFWCHLQCHWSDQVQNEDRIAWITGFYHELKPYLNGAYINAPDAELPNALQEYYGENLPKLRQIKHKYDPENIFHYPQSIPPAAGLD